MVVIVFLDLIVGIDRDITSSTINHHGTYTPIFLFSFVSWVISSISTISSVISMTITMLTPIPERLFDDLGTITKRLNINVDDLVVSLISGWVEKRRATVLDTKQTVMTDFSTT
jgi:hypothetical protein